MLELLYVARALGYDETILPAKIIDSMLKVCHVVKVPSKYCSIACSTQFTIKTWGSHERNVHQLLPPIPSHSQHQYESASTEGLQTIGVNYQPSMLIDLQKGRPTELETTLGSVLDHARWTGTDTPRLDLLYALMKVKQESAVLAEGARLQIVQETNFQLPTPLSEDAPAAQSDKVRGRPVSSQAYRDEDAGWPSVAF